MNYMDDRLGFVDEFDCAWVMDDFGELVAVDFCLPCWFFNDM